MEHQLWLKIEADLQRLAPRWHPRLGRFSDATIVRVYYWAVLHDRPVLWACCKDHWPIHLRRRPLPSPATMSRRLRRTTVVTLLNTLAAVHLQAPTQPPLVHRLDGKPLPIGGCSKDRQAGYGRAASGKAKGYKLHALVGSDGSLPVWRLAPMNVDERVMARRLLRQAAIQGYVVADSNYDDNKIHAVCDAKGELQLLTPKRGGPGKGLGHRPQTPGRLRSLERVYHPTSNFGQGMLQERSAVERYFGNLTSFGGGLTHLPPWVRTHRRVYRWVQAKLVLNRLRMQLRQRTYVA
jgi:DDE family transposase